MKYSGTIIGLESDFGSIYNVVTYDKKCYIWKANVIAEFNGKMLTISFNWDGDSFDIKMTMLKENYYTGKIYRNHELAGSIFLWRFLNGDEMILRGDFEEDDAGTFNCFLELRPYKL